VWPNRAIHNNKQEHEVSWRRRQVLHNERVEQANQENADTMNEIRIYQIGGDTLNDKKVILAAMDKLDTYAKTKREITESEQKQKNTMKIQMKRAMAQKAKAKDSRKTITTASQESQILARLTMVNMIGMTVGTILAQISSRGIMTTAKVTKQNLIVTRRWISKENPTRKPSSLRASHIPTKSGHNQILWPFGDSESDKESDNLSVISADFYFNSDDNGEHNGAILMTSDAADTGIHPITGISMPGTNGTITATSCLID
jgi:hypothetical protein